MLGVIRNVVLHFILYFVPVYIRKYSMHVTSAHGTTSLEEVSKKPFMTNNFATVTTHKKC